MHVQPEKPLLQFFGECSRASASFEFETRIMLTCMSTSRSNYFDMSIWKKHADHSTTTHRYKSLVYQCL